MRTVLRERVFELHEALKGGGMPQKEASVVRDYAQCERCSYVERCNPFLIEAICLWAPKLLFLISTASFSIPLRKDMPCLQELGLPPSSRPSDIHDEDTKKKYWELLD